MAVNIQSYYDIHPTNPSIRKDVLTPDFLERFAIVKKFIIEGGSLLIDKYDDSDYKIHIKNNDKGIVVEGIAEPKLTLKINSSTDEVHITTDTNGNLIFKKNNTNLLNLDDNEISSSIPFTLDTINADNLNVNGSPLDDYIDNHISNIINECKSYTDNHINDYNNNIVIPSFLHKFSPDTQVVHSRVEFTGEVAFNGTADQINLLRKDTDDWPILDDTYELGKSDKRWHSIYARRFVGTLHYSGGDIAEKYTIDDKNREPEIGDVILISEKDEFDCEISNDIGSHRVLGVISENPGVCLNTELENGYFIALKGRVKCKVRGPIQKGDPLISYNDGHAASILENIDDIERIPGIIFAKALETTYKPYDIIEVVII